MTDEKIKHLEFIQTIITRMNKNSFQLKGWNITIVSAFLALYASSHNITYIFVSLFPVVIFWFLDSYYLQQERKFRGIYNDIIKDASTINLFDMPLKNYTKDEYSLWSCFKSKTILFFYGSIFCLLLIIGTILHCKNISIMLENIL